ncbi:hypothetical protein RRF57_011366 [Xylaria bambusicola]|uniref:Uncharacterized protein n=1 Tax=Xylaria bambusicola TaxID=326684 RepID=A0AAN7V2M5_9PEZI
MPGLKRAGCLIAITVSTLKAVQNDSPIQWPSIKPQILLSPLDYCLLESTRLQPAVNYFIDRCPYSNFKEYHAQAIHLVLAVIFRSVLRIRDSQIRMEVYRSHIQIRVD